MKTGQQIAKYVNQGNVSERWFLELLGASGHNLKVIGGFIEDLPSNPEWELYMHNSEREQQLESGDLFCTKCGRIFEIKSKSKDKISMTAKDVERDPDEKGITVLFPIWTKGFGKIYKVYAVSLNELIRKRYKAEKETNHFGENYYIYSHQILSYTKIAINSNTKKNDILTTINEIGLGCKA